MRENGELLLRDYILQTIQPVESYRGRYPQLIFEPIVSDVIHIEVPLGAEEGLERLRQSAGFLKLPVLYGLNSREAFIESHIAMFHDYPFGPLTGSNVMIGFVDTGIDYTNKVFRNEDGTTRIISLWDQTLSGDPPEGYTYGSEYRKRQIDAALISENPYEVVPSRDEIGHGTFLAGLAAGDDKTGTQEYRGGAPDAFIAMVKLRPAKAYLKTYYLIEEDDIAYQENDFLAGIHYLFQLSLELNIPLVICIGMGNNVGAHNGTTLTEMYLNTLSIARNVIIVVAAGNEANSGHHFSGTILPQETRDIEINVSEEEKSGFITYLWADIADKIAVSLRSPIGQLVERIPVEPDSTIVYTFGLEATRITVTYNYPDSQTGLQNTIIRFQKPTPGLWSVTIYGQEINDGHYHMWLQRNDFITPNTRFLRAETLMTIENPSTSEYVITVGAYDYIDQSIYAGSGRGPTSDHRIKPELIAPGVNVSGPIPGGGYTTYIGTSTAAAITASAAVLLMQWAVFQGNLEAMNTRIARGLLIRGAVRRRAIDYPNPIEGYGRLDLRGTISGI